MISLIVAMSENRVIGRNDRLPWHLPADLKRFKQITTGHTVIMGRKTYESMGKPLPNRRNIIVTRNPNYHPAGAEVARSLDQAIALAKDQQEIFVIGGSQIFRDALPHADRIYLTLVRATVEGDAFFPEFNPAEWSLIQNEMHNADERHQFAMSFQRYDRVPHHA